MKAVKCTGNKITLCFQFCYVRIIIYFTHLVLRYHKWPNAFPFLHHFKTCTYSYITKSKWRIQLNFLSKLIWLLYEIWVHNIFKKKSDVPNIAAIPAFQRLKQENRGVWGHSVLYSEFSDSQDYVRSSENKTIKERTKERKCKLRAISKLP